MAPDGIKVAALVQDLKAKLIGGSIARITQPVKYGLLLTVHAGERYYLYISASPSAQGVWLRNEPLPAPDTAPAFCMALRKHIGGGRILDIIQPTSEVTGLRPGLERVIVIGIEHRNELGDKELRYLIAELMGKHANIILCREDFGIIDSIRHVSYMTSSLREVLPGRDYFFPKELAKADPLSVRDPASFLAMLRSVDKGEDVCRRLYGTFAGIGPRTAADLIMKAAVDGEKTASDLSCEEAGRLFGEFRKLMDLVESGGLDTGLLAEEAGKEEEKAGNERLRALRGDIAQVLRRQRERVTRKLDLHEKELTDAASRDKYKKYADLILTYAYTLGGGEESLCCEDPEEGTLVRVPLDKDLSPQENAKKYYERYAKLKRTGVKALEQKELAGRELWQIESLEHALSLAGGEADIDQIRLEMRECGYLRDRSRPDRKKREKSVPLHFVSSDGIDIYVGKNDYQNEELSFHTADPDDWWFHAKGVPGSHVIARTGRRELPDRTCLEAAALAAYYSGARTSKLVEVDYTVRRFLKKVPGAPRGYCIYHHNYSITIEPRESV